MDIFWHKLSISILLFNRFGHESDWILKTEVSATYISIQVKVNIDSEVICTPYIWVIDEA